MADIDHTRFCDTNYDFKARCSCGGDVTTLTVDELRAEVRRLRAIVRAASSALRGEVTRG